MRASLNRRLYFAAQAFRKEPVKKALKDLEGSLYLNLLNLEKIQNQRLVDLLKHAMQTVPFYQELYKPWINEFENLSVNNVKTLIIKLPVVQKSEILQDRSQLFSSKTYKTHTNISSGTTGEPFAYPCDQLAWAYRHASLIRLIEYNGVAYGSRYGYFFGQHWKSEFKYKTKVKDWFFNRDRFSAFDITPNAVNETYKKFLKNKTQYFMGYPSTVVEFCKIAFEELRLDLTKLNLKLFVATGETLEPFQKKYIEKVLGCSVVNYYGSAEGGFGCFTGKEGLMQENMETCYLELDENNKVSKTDLFLRQFPLIKIQTDDVCEPIDTEVETALNHRVLGTISGRTGDNIILPNGKKVHAVILDYFFDLFINDENILKFRFEFYNDKVCLLIKSKKESIEKKFKEQVVLEFTRLFPETRFIIKQVKEIPFMANGKNRPWVQL